MNIQLISGILLWKYTYLNLEALVKVNMNMSSSAKGCRTLLISFLIYLCLNSSSNQASTRTPRIKLYFGLFLVPMKSGWSTRSQKWDKDSLGNKTIKWNMDRITLRFSLVYSDIKAVYPIKSHCFAPIPIKINQIVWLKYSLQTSWIMMWFLPSKKISLFILMPFCRE